MPVLDLTAYLADSGLTLKGISSRKHPGGKAYTFQSPPAERGMWLRDLVQYGIASHLGDVSDSRLDNLVLDEDEERDLYREVMGPTLQELLADGVPWVSVQRIFGLLLRHYGADRDIRTELLAFGEATAAEAVASDLLSEARETDAAKASAKKTPAKNAATARKAPAKKPIAKAAKKAVR